MTVVNLAAPYAMLIAPGAADKLAAALQRSGALFVKSSLLVGPDARVLPTHFCVYDRLSASAVVQDSPVVLHFRKIWLFLPKPSLSRPNPNQLHAEGWACSAQRWRAGCALCVRFCAQAAALPRARPRCHSEVSLFCCGSCTDHLLWRCILVYRVCIPTRASSHRVRYEEILCKLSQVLRKMSG